MITTDTATQANKLFHDAEFLAKEAIKLKKQADELKATSHLLATVAELKRIEAKKLLLKDVAMTDTDPHF